MTEAMIPNMSMTDLLKSPEVANQVPDTVLETQLATVTPEDAAATTVEEAKFQFRSLLPQDYRDSIVANAPKTAMAMVDDYNLIISFGEPVIQKLNSASVSLLNEQKGIKLPEADEVVNNLLREMDGFDKKYRNAKLEDTASKIKNWFSRTSYSLSSMVRDAQPIVARIDKAEANIFKMEKSLGENVRRGKILHNQTLMTMQDVIVVLASLEQISEYLMGEVKEADRVLEEARGKGNLASLEFRGKTYSLQDFTEIHANLVEGLRQVELSWFDWRQQFFLGFASAPSLRNLMLVSATMQRRLQVFRTQGLTSARNSLAMWQQAALAKEAGAMGNTVQDGINTFVTRAMENTASAVDEVAHSSQAPVITEETVFAVIKSVKDQAASILAADKWGRDLRERNLNAMESGEKSMTEANRESRRQLVANVVQGTSTSAIESGPGIQGGDMLGSLGIK